MTITELQNYIEMTEKCAQCCRELLDQEQEKRQALLGSDDKRLGAVLQAQQAAVMKLDGLEKRRIAAQSAAGFASKNAEEVLAGLPEGAEKERLGKLFDEMRRTARELKELNKTALNIARESLYLIEAVTGQARREAGGTYKPGRPMDRTVRGIGFEEKI